MAKSAVHLLTVLVVDDFKDSRRMLRRMLEMRNCAVLEADDGEEAVIAARGACPDLVLLDLNMPRMDGLEAAQKIRALRGQCAHVPIIAITAFDTYGMKEAALAAGCDVYLTKPIDFEDLDREISRLLPGWLAG